MKSVWTPEKQTIARLRNWLVLAIGGLTVSAVLFFNYASRVEVSGYRASYEEVANHKPEKSIAAKVADDPIALFTLILTAFTGGLFWATFALWAATRRLVVGAEETAERQLRAYVCTTRATFADLSKSALYFIEYTNCGQTPALKVKVTAQTGLINKDGLPILDFTDRNSRLHGLIGPGKAAFERLEASRALEASELAEIRDGTKEVFCVGFIEYADIFGRTHKTSFHYKVLSIDARSDEGSLAIGGGQNTAD